METGILPPFTAMTRKFRKTPAKIFAKTFLIPVHPEKDHAGNVDEHKDVAACVPTNQSSLESGI